MKDFISIKLSMFTNLLIITNLLRPIGLMFLVCKGKATFCGIFTYKIDYTHTVSHIIMFSLLTKLTASKQTKTKIRTP